MNIIKFFAHCTAISTRADRSLKVVFETQEADDSLASEIIALRHKVGFLVFAEQDLRPEDIDVPDVEPEFRGEKSPGQRLRAVLYRLWEQSPERGVKSHEAFYRDEMEKVIEHYKKKLD